MKKVILNDTFDAVIWTEEWLKTIKKKPDIPTDEGTMISWFANAIMAGYDYAYRQIQNNIISGNKELKMKNKESKPAFEGWAIVELFGHNQIAGYVTEVAAFGTSMMRVDVPTINDQPGYTKLFGGAAVYALTPTSEEIATEAARRLDIRPVANWVVPDPKPQLVAKTFEPDEKHPDDIDYPDDIDEGTEEPFERDYDDPQIIRSTRTDNAIPF